MKRKEMLRVQQLVPIPALVEALGYGRDRAFFRALGQRLVGLPGDIPEPAGRAAQPSPLDATRLHASGNLVEQWRAKGAWETIKNTIINVNDQCNTHRSHCRGGGGVERGGDPCGRPRACTCGPLSIPSVIAHLRAIFPNPGPARADILICNVVLPFAAAIAHLEQDQLLLEQAQDLYRAYPGLASNQVTRSMYRQLRLKREPRNACQQQGLHHIYAQTCREKQCATCIVVRREEA